MPEDNGIVFREKEKSLHISRIPRKTKEEFVAFAEEEFAGDYGMTLAFLVNSNEEKVKFEYLLARVEQLEDMMSIHIKSHLGQTSKPEPKFLSSWTKSSLVFTPSNLVKLC